MNAQPHGQVYLTRQVEFAAAHKLYLKELSDSDNFELFGQCANPNGHGHNYLLEATFVGVPDTKTGMVIHFNTLHRLLDEIVVLQMDHRNLNEDVGFLKDCLPTSENVVIRLWTQISHAVGSKEMKLHKLKLKASSRNWVEYFGPDQAPEQAKEKERDTN